jgi:hypothetical protein
MEDEVRHVSSPASSVNGHYEIAQPPVAEPTTSNGHLTSTARKARAEISDSESTGSTTSETSSENEETDELHEDIYFDKAGDTPIVNQASSRQHEVATAPLFTNSALECMNTGAKVKGIRARIQEY